MTAQITHLLNTPAPVRQGDVLLLPVLTVADECLDKIDIEGEINLL